MFKVMMIFVAMYLYSSVCIAGLDDSERYKAAKFYHKKAQKAVDKHRGQLEGFCQLMLQMDYQHQKYATLKRITYTGDHKLCLVAKKAMQKYKRVKYDRREHLLKIFISTH